MRIGSRGSRLALTQAEHVSKLLGSCEIVTITTSGDAAQGRSGDNVSPSDKSKWVDNIERALLSGEIDLAVHSAKDLPIEMAEGLQLLGCPERAPAEDVVCGAPGLGVGGAPGLGVSATPALDVSASPGLERLPAGSIVGTSSLRRRAQLLAAFPELQVVPVGGNVDTRLAKLKASATTSPSATARATAGATAGVTAGSLSAIVLARAGLRRLGLEAEISTSLDVESFVPSPGQGALALQGRIGDNSVREAVEAIVDPTALACLKAERSVARALGASCNTPLGVHASPLSASATASANGGQPTGGHASNGHPSGSRPSGDRAILLRAWLGLPDGSTWLRDEIEGDASQPEELGTRLASRLKSAGAGDLLAKAEAMAA